MWVLHVLREHLRDLLASCEMRVKFNAAGGATVEVFDAYVEDVALIRDTLGVQLLGVLDLPTSRGCVVIFGGDPYARQVSMVWYTWPRFLRLADQLNSALWSIGNPGSTERAPAAPAVPGGRRDVRLLPHGGRGVPRLLHRSGIAAFAGLLVCRRCLDGVRDGQRMQVTVVDLERSGLVDHARERRPR